MILPNLAAAPETDPVAIYRWRDGLYAADLLTCALAELDLFSWINRRPATLPEICQHFSIAPRPADVMLTLFVAMGFLRREGETVLLTRQAGEHLVRDSPFFIGPYFASLKERPVCRDFLRVLRTDRPASWGSYQDEKDWARAMEGEAFAESFTAAMDCRGLYLSQALAKALDLSSTRALLDVAGGSGIYACSLVAHYPHLAAAVFEKPPVHQIAARAIAKRGFAGRVRVLEGDMLAGEFPAGFDAHLLSNVLHDWNEATVAALLRKSFAALAPGGLLIIHDVFINAEKSGPLPAAAYSALLMNISEGKCYSLSELHPMLESTGFQPGLFRETAADRGVLTARRRGQVSKSPI